jgi:hypothetical protein
MKPKNLIPVAAFIPLVPAVSAGSTWYVNGASGSDDNACKSPAAACKTIGHAISLAASGDGILVAEATYEERLTINASVSIVGSSATTRIIDGQEPARWSRFPIRLRPSFRSATVPSERIRYLYDVLRLEEHYE